LLTFLLTVEIDFNAGSTPDPEYSEQEFGSGNAQWLNVLEFPKNCDSFVFMRKLSKADAQTKEQLGGILVLEARDLDHAIQLMSKHPGVKLGPFEIRPGADLTDMVGETERRRVATT
jgi:hypothetical protein